MKYNYYPNTIDLELINQKNIDSDYVLLQQKYIESFEFYIMQKMDIKKYDLIITQFSSDISNINDIDNNIYKKSSALKSDYIYLRNNIHIERLEMDEIDEIRNAIIKNNILPFSFIKKTIYLMINEGNKKISYGYDSFDDYFDPNIFIFEFSYFSSKINNAINFLEIKKHFNKVADMFCREFSEKFDCKSTYRIYMGLPLLYEINEIGKEIE